MGSRTIRLIAAVAGILVLGGIAIPALDMKLGAPDFGQLPTDTTERQAYDALTEGFGVGTNGPFLLAVDVYGKPLASDPSTVQQLQTELQQVQEEEATERARPRSSSRSNSNSRSSSRSPPRQRATHAWSTWSRRSPSRKTSSR